MIVAVVLWVARAAGCHQQTPITGTPLPDDSSPLSGSEHVPFGVPTDQDPSDDLLLDKKVFVLSYNEQKREANWVAWKLRQSDLGTTRRTSRFHEEEELLPTARVSDADYRGSGWDRGHLCPSGDRTRDESTNFETFSLANVHPQHHDLNAGPWERLEDHARDLARQGWVSWIVAGGLYEQPRRTVGRGVVIPSASWKVLLALPSSHHGDPLEALSSGVAEAKVIAVIMPNVPGIRQEPFSRYQVSVDEVERRSGYDFLRRLPKNIQDDIEAR